MIKNINLLVDQSATKKEKFLAFISIQMIAVVLIYVFGFVTGYFPIEGSLLDINMPPEPNGATIDSIPAIFRIPIVLLGFVIVAPFIIVIFAFFPILGLLALLSSLFGHGLPPMGANDFVLLGLCALSLTFYRLHKTSTTPNVSATFFILFTLMHMFLSFGSLYYIGGT